MESQLATGRASARKCRADPLECSSVVPQLCYSSQYHYIELRKHYNMTMKFQCCKLNDNCISIIIVILLLLLLHSIVIKSFNTGDNMCIQIIDIME